MGSKTISVKDETYDRLTRVKGPDESFSDVIDRILAEEEHPLYDLVGLLPAEEVDRLRGHADAFRSDVDDRLRGDDSP